MTTQNTTQFEKVLKFLETPEVAGLGMFLIIFVPLYFAVKSLSGGHGE